LRGGREWTPKIRLDSSVSKELHTPHAHIPPPNILKINIRTTLRPPILWDPRRVNAPNHLGETVPVLWIRIRLRPFFCRRSADLQTTKRAQKLKAPHRLDRSYLTIGPIPHLPSHLSTRKDTRQPASTEWDSYYARGADVRYDEHFGQEKESLEFSMSGAGVTVHMYLSLKFVYQQLPLPFAT